MLRMIVGLPLALAGTAFAAGSSDTNASELMRDFTYVFGPLSTVSSPGVLEHAVELAEKAGKPSVLRSLAAESGGGASIAEKKFMGCMSYIAGVDVAQAHISTCGKPKAPLLVPIKFDKAGKKMCFLFDGSLAAEEQTKFTMKHAIPSAITVDPALYTLIDSITKPASTAAAPGVLETAPLRSDDMLSVYVLAATATAIKDAQC